MLAIAEIEGDPFKIDEAKLKLEREVGPLEIEVNDRKKRLSSAAAVHCGGVRAAKISGSGGGGGISSAFGLSINAGLSAKITNNHDVDAEIHYLAIDDLPTSPQSSSSSSSRRYGIRK